MSDAQNLRLPQQTPSVVLETPLVGRASAKTSGNGAAFLSVPGSAMKGIILTATGEPVQTPHSASAELSKIIMESPRVGLNFRKIFDFEDEETEDEESDDGQHEIEQEESSGDGREDDLQTPSRCDRQEKVKSVSKSKDSERPFPPSLVSRSRPKSQSQSQESQESSGSSTSGKSQVHAAPTRLRRPSIRKSPGSQTRPGIPQSFSCPTLPSASGASANSASAQQGNEQARASAPPVPRRAPPPTPRYDPADEENLPSPFLRRAEIDRLTAQVRASGQVVAASAPSGVLASGSGTVAARRKSRGNGNMLRVMAAANSAYAIHALESGSAAP